MLATVIITNILSPVWWCCSQGHILLEADGWQVLSWKYTVIFGFIAAMIGLFQAIFNTAQKFKELRWNQADLATKIIDQLYDFGPADTALKMIDGQETLSPTGQPISVKDIENALRLSDTSKKGDYIRDCFDGLLYYFERIEHSVSIGVVKIEDVKMPFAYYMGNMAIQKNALLEYCKFIKYSKAAFFINRFQE